MSKFQAKKAVRTKRPLKVSIEGLSGSGKTFTALRLAFDMRRHGIGKKIVVFDSENGSASLYAGVEIDGERWDFDTVELTPDVCNPLGYAEAYRWATAPAQGYDIILFDSLSHAWHGALDLVDQAGKGDKFRGWATVTPQQREMLVTLTDVRAHTLCTMRVKGEYERGKNDKGKDTIVKVGTKVDQREGSEYEFDLVLRFEKGNTVRVDKVRGCSAMDGKSGPRPGPAFWAPLFAWWQGGADVPADVTDLVKATMKASGKTWAEILAWLNGREGTDHATYAADAKFGDIATGDLKAWVHAHNPH